MNNLEKIVSTLSGQEQEKFLLILNVLKSDEVTSLAMKLGISRIDLVDILTTSKTIMNTNISSNNTKVSDK